MGKKLLIISEEEKKQIKELHKLNEQDEILKSLINSFLGGKFDFFKKKEEKKGQEKKDENTTTATTNTTTNGSKPDFKKVTRQIINTLEGGYYNPKWHYKKAMLDSGETMFGIDRKHGGTINTSPAGLKFWGLIDKNKNSKVWTHGYRGGSLENQLTDLAADIMEPVFESNSKRYLSPKAREIVNSDERLLFHFIYGSWNGPDWFRRFAEVINDAVNKGITDKEALVKIALDRRAKSGNNLIARGGEKIKDLYNVA